MTAYSSELNDFSNAIRPINPLEVFVLYKYIKYIILRENIIFFCEWK